MPCGALSCASVIMAVITGFPLSVTVSSLTSWLPPLTRPKASPSARQARWVVFQATHLASTGHLLLVELVFKRHCGLGPFARNLQYFLRVPLGKVLFDLIELAIHLLLEGFDGTVVGAQYIREFALGLFRALPPGPQQRVVRGDRSARLKRILHYRIRRPAHPRIPFQ